MFATAGHAGGYRSSENGCQFVDLRNFKWSASSVNERRGAAAGRVHSEWKSHFLQHCARASAGDPWPEASRSDANGSKDVESNPHGLSVFSNGRCQNSGQPRNPIRVPKIGTSQAHRLFPSGRRSDSFWPSSEARPGAASAAWKHDEILARPMGWCGMVPENCDTSEICPIQPMYFVQESRWGTTILRYVNIWHMCKVWSVCVTDPYEVWLNDWYSGYCWDVHHAGRTCRCKYGSYY